MLLHLKYKNIKELRNIKAYSLNERELFLNVSNRNCFILDKTIKESRKLSPALNVS